MEQRAGSGGISIAKLPDDFLSTLLLYPGEIIKPAIKNINNKND
jgi:hypothetical protein